MVGCGILIPEVLEEIACHGFNSTLMERERRGRERENGKVNTVLSLFFSCLDS